MGAAGQQSDIAFGQPEYDRLGEIIRSQSGYVLAAHKQDGLYRRLLTRLRALHLESFKDYCAFVAQDPDGVEVGRLVQGIFRNAPRLFADAQQIKYLAKWIESRARAARLPSRSRVWVAGCGAGEDAYTLAMLVARYLQPLSRIDFRVLATDLDADKIARARSGQFDQAAVFMAPEACRTQWLTRTADATCEMHAGLRDLIDFRQYNLLNDLPSRRRFDAILCRGLLPEFDRPHREIALRRFRDRLHDDGRLYLSQNETISTNQWFDPVAPGVFRLRTRAFQRSRAA